MTLIFLRSYFYLDLNGNGFVIIFLLQKRSDTNNFIISNNNRKEAKTISGFPSAQASFAILCHKIELCSRRLFLLIQRRLDTIQKLLVRVRQNFKENEHATIRRDRSASKHLIKRYPLTKPELQP